jgi:preprotein translocase subunit YajC
MNQDIFLVIALGFLIVMMFLSSRKRKKAAEALQSDLKKGSSVVLHSGIVGTVTEINGDKLTIESTPGTSLLVLKGAVRSVEAGSKAPASKAASKPAAAKTGAAKPVAAKPVAKKPATKPAAK